MLDSMANILVLKQKEFFFPLVPLVTLSIKYSAFSLPWTERKTFAAVLTFWPAPTSFYLIYSCLTASSSNSVSNNYLSKYQNVTFQHRNASLNSNGI